MYLAASAAMLARLMSEDRDGQPLVELDHLDGDAILGNSVDFVIPDEIGLDPRRSARTCNMDPAEIAERDRPRSRQERRQLARLKAKGRAQ